MSSFGSQAVVIKRYTARQLLGRQLGIVMETLESVDIKDFEKVGSLTKKEVYRWNMDYSRLRTAECKIRSDIFTFGPCRHSKFYLVAFAAFNAPFFSLALCRIKLGSCTVDDNLFIKVAFSLLDMRDRCHHTCERQMRDCEVVQTSFDRSCYTTSQMTFIKDGRLRIQCTLDIDELLQEEKADEVTSTISSPIHGNLIHDLSGDLRTLLDSGLHSDVVLSAGGHDYPAHRSILSARSPVFAAMFEHETVEKMQNRVEIEDLTSEAMHQLLRFLYSGETDELKTQELLALFVAADKYNLPKLRKRCSSLLCNQVTPDIVLSVLVIANLHQDENMKEAATQTVLDHAIDVMKSDEWLTFLREYPETANSIILKLAMKTLKISEGKPSLTTNL